MNAWLNLAVGTRQFLTLSGALNSRVSIEERKFFHDVDIYFSLQLLSSFSCPSFFPFVNRQRLKLGVVKSNVNLMYTYGAKQHPFS